VSALDKLRASNTCEITLANGSTVTVKRVADIWDAILIGEDIPLPVLKEMESEDTEDAPDRSPTERIAFLRDSRKRQDWAIRAAVVAIDGEPTTLPEEVPLAELFATPERRQIADFALWADAEGEA
jgi:hypothetical protein